MEESHPVPDKGILEYQPPADCRYVSKSKPDLPILAQKGRTFQPAYGFVTNNKWMLF